MDGTTDLQIALDHPLRQALLSALASNPEGLSLTELAGRFPNASISAVSYHLRLLGRCGTVSPTATPWKNGSQIWRYGVDYAQV